MTVIWSLITSKIVRSEEGVFSCFIHLLVTDSMINLCHKEVKHPGKLKKTQTRLRRYICEDHRSVFLFTF